ERRVADTAVIVELARELEREPAPFAHEPAGAGHSRCLHSSQSTSSAPASSPQVMPATNASSITPAPIRIADAQHVERHPEGAQAGDPRRARRPPARATAEHEKAAC